MNSNFSCFLPEVTQFSQQKTFFTLPLATCVLIGNTSGSITRRFNGLMDYAKGGTFKHNFECSNCT